MRDSIFKFTRATSSPRYAENTFSRLFLIVLFAACTLSAAGCIQGAPAITIEGQEAMLSPVIVGVGSVFMRIVNAGSGDDTLLAARTDIPDTVVELHDFRDGKMTRTNSVRVPSKSTVRLRPAGPHIMIFKLPNDMKKGRGFRLTLMFEKSGEREISIATAVVPSSPSK